MNKHATNLVHFLPPPNGEDIVDIGTATRTFDLVGLQRLKLKHCAELVGEARSALDFCLFVTPNVQVTKICGRQQGKNCCRPRLPPQVYLSRPTEEVQIKRYYTIL